AAGRGAGATDGRRAADRAARHRQPPELAGLGRRLRPARRLEVVEVLDYPPGVVDHLVLVHEHGDPPLAGQLVDLVAVPPPDRHPDLLVVDARAPQPPGHLAARAEPVGRRLAAVQDGHGLRLTGLAHSVSGHNRLAASPN